ncbi:hypothetical protein JI739_21365 [Ramlibacter sp. AW1]|uniref:Virulence factor n=1 Tax=Ramlibacter aurantiacus TaxID=2801330 RepID=A0A937D3P0_9BURK|nr:hypothetical protein [Ramlibacter aurantiacus]MBL0422899.1 hypothetical protein [Ramlibacter aurantiacus]
MNRLSPTRSLLLAAAALASLAMASAAHARSDVHFSIGINAPLPYVVHPAPVYVQPAPVYVHPAPVYVQPRPVYVQPAPVYAYPQPIYYDRPQHWVPPGHRHGHGHGHRGHRGGWGDADRDGVPNRYDRAPHDRHWR